MNLILVTDLDGTLLDHKTYSYMPAKPALDALAKAGIPVVLATSKTAAEVAPLHAELDLDPTPAIVENGAGLMSPAESKGSADKPAGHRPIDNGAYKRVRHALETLPVSLRNRFTGFGDLNDEDVAKLTGLPPDAARNARKRAYSEPGLWAGTSEELAQFQAKLAHHGVYARRGGRFLTLSEGRSKADAMREVAKSLRADCIIALGDAPNDTEMIEAAEMGVIVRNDHGTALPHLKGEAEGRIRRTHLEGPAGWNEAVLAILAELKVT